MVILCLSYFITTVLILYNFAFTNSLNDDLSMPFNSGPILNSSFSVYEILSIYNFDFTNSFSDYSLKPSHQGFKNYQMVIFKTTLLHQKSALTF